MGMDVFDRVFQRDDVDGLAWLISFRTAARVVDPAGRAVTSTRPVFFARDAG
jgi:hypothetical protein